MWFCMQHKRKEVKKFRRNATSTVVLDSEFNDKLGIQSPLCAGENGDVLSRKKLRTHSVLDLLPQNY